MMPIQLYIIHEPPAREAKRLDRFALKLDVGKWQILC
jgi:hypothetical protein